MEHTKGHNELAELLLQREVIYTEDAERIFGPRQWTSRTEEILKANESETKADDNQDTKTDTGNATVSTEDTP